MTGTACLRSATTDQSLSSHACSSDAMLHSFVDADKMGMAFSRIRCIQPFPLLGLWNAVLNVRLRDVLSSLNLPAIMHHAAAANPSELPTIPSLRKLFLLASQSLPLRRSLNYPSLLLGREERSALLKCIHEQVDGIVLKVVGRAHLVQILGKLLGCSLEVV